MRYQAIDPRLFIGNRRRLQERLKPGEAVVLRAAKDPGGRIDESQSYRQDSNFFWATGIDQNGCLLVLTASEETLFVRLPNAFERTWLDERLTLEQAAKISGVANVLPMAKYRKPAGIMDPTRHLAGLRAVKQPAELKLIERSIAITAEGLRAAAKAITPGVIEYEIEADFTRELTRRGAGNAWPPVVASGPNTCVMHYGDNARKLQPGELILIDVGAEYAHYDADISRTYPVGGSFTARQREVYEAALAVQKTAMTLLRPGVLLMDYEREVAEQMFTALKSLGVVTDSDRERDKLGMPRWRHYFPHRTSHYLGLDPHDLGDYEQPLEVGTVLTVEPGIYLPKEGIGIRLEDDVVITKTGVKNLSAEIPIELHEIGRG